MTKKTGMAQDGYQPLEKGYHTKNDIAKPSNQTYKPIQQPLPPPNKP
ncbi:hypothetical protein [Pantoea ananatis]|nr:hypothetical protein [Pantoea ananatis]